SPTVPSPRCKRPSKWWRRLPNNLSDHGLVYEDGLVLCLAVTEATAMVGQGRRYVGMRRFHSHGGARARLGRRLSRGEEQRPPGAGCPPIPAPTAGAPRTTPPTKPGAPAR